MYASSESQKVSLISWIRRIVFYFKIQNLLNPAPLHNLPSSISGQEILEFQTALRQDDKKNIGQFDIIILKQYELYYLNFYFAAKTC